MEPLDIKSVRDIGLNAASYTRSSALIRKLGWFIYRPYILTLFQKFDELRQNIDVLRQETETLKAHSGAALAHSEHIVHDVQTSTATLAAQFQEQEARLNALTETQAQFNALMRDYLHSQKAVGIDLYAMRNRLQDMETKTAVADRIQALERSLARITQEAAELGERNARDDERMAQRALRDEANENRLRQIEAIIAQLTAGLNDLLSRTIPAAQPAPTAPAAVELEIPNTHFYLYEGPYGRFMLRRQDLISDVISRGEFWDPHLEPVIREAAARGGTAIDAGAYFGFISVQLAKAFPCVISFEPQLEIFQNLNTNLMLNGCHNVVTHNMGLYSKAGFLSLANPDLQDIEIPCDNGFVDYDACPNAAAVAFEFADEPQVPQATKATVRIRATTIDSLGLDDVSFIKIDCQGADYHVLLGAEETIRRSRPVIVFESEHYLEQGRSIMREDYEKLMSQLGYTMTEISNKGDGKQIDFLAVLAG